MIFAKQDKSQFKNLSTDKNTHPISHEEIFDNIFRDYCFHAVTKFFWTQPGYMAQRNY